ncbi:MAG: DNA polymerase III subunit gamma/tau [Geminicoccaceae bacterium]
MSPDQPIAYRVLARSYRPTRLSELIGQDALVRTLGNALASGRVAHAFMLSGIRGVGKTTTARIIARALNCTGPDGSGGPTPEPCGTCPSCVAIAGDRSLDVIEMDAATNTGINDIRDIVATVAFGPAASRYKVYIIDEVHMLSAAAFNGLLKTLEEPPPHVKFVFATTELRKVPVTVLSRCQRFELRRVEPEVIKAHLANVCAREKVEADAEALALIARLAGGSVRDSLSLLDQAIALGEGHVAVGPVREMLGLADQTQLVALFAAALRGQAGDALERMAELHRLGADPAAVLVDLLDLCHRLSRLEASPQQAATDPTLDPAARPLAAELGIGALTRAWQMLLRGIEEVNAAPDALAAAEMILLRLATMAQLPPPGELLRIAQGDAAVPAAAAVPAPRPAPSGGRPQASAVAVAIEPRPAEGGPDSWPALVALLRDQDEPMLAAWLHEGAHLVRFEPGRLELRLTPGLPPDLPNRLSNALLRITTRRWLVSVVNAGGEPTLSAQADAARDRRLAELADEPAIRSLLEQFPGARIVDVRTDPDNPAPGTGSP